MRFVYTVLFIVFLLFRDYTDTLFTTRFVVSLSLGERSSGSIGQNY